MGRLKRRAAALAAAALTTCAAIAQTAGEPWADPSPRALASPHFGEVLFGYHQDRVFSALTTLMVSQHYRRLGSHAAEAELLRGGLQLSYGQHDEAAAVFAPLIDTTAQPAVRDRAGYFLALARQQRGLPAQAEDALARIRNPLPGALQAERLLLQSQLLMARGDFAGAAGVLENIGSDGTAARYGRYNLAVALIQQHQPALRARGLAVLDALGQLPADDEEQRSLRDRANLARGYAALADRQPRDARVALQRVRLNGVLSNQALLGYGWAAMGLNDPRLALVPWQELAGRQNTNGDTTANVDAAVLEARLAVPYALGEIGAFGQALAGYQQAAAGYAQALRALDDTIAAVQRGRFIDTLLGDEDAATRGRFTGVQALPATPQAAPLLPLLAGNAFHEGLKNLRDLQFARRNAAQWLDALGSFDDMLDNRRRAFAERLPQVLAQRGAAAIAQLQQQRDALAAEIAQAERAADGRAYANAAEQQLMARLQRSRDTLAKLGAAPVEQQPDGIDSVQAAAIANRLRLAEGVLSWQLAQAQPARAGAAKQALRDSDSTLAEARAHETALVAAQQREPARQAAFAQRIAALRTRLAAIAPQAQALAAEQQQQLQALAVDELKQQQARLQVYAAQASLAIAQVQDSALFARQAAQEAEAAKARNLRQALETQGTEARP